jgi:hypothetical protein
MNIMDLLELFACPLQHSFMQNRFHGVAEGTNLVQYDDRQEDTVSHGEDGTVYTADVAIFLQNFPKITHKTVLGPNAQCESIVLLQTTSIF